jgi:hypothetical protein
MSGSTRLFVVRSNEHGANGNPVAFMDLKPPAILKYMTRDAGTETVCISRV